MALFIIGLAIGITLILIIIRKLGKASTRSLVVSELFYKITKYRAAIYNIQRQPYNISVTVQGGEDSANLLDILTNQMGFKIDKAKEAVKHALDIARDKPLQEKITEALKFIDSKNNR